MLLLLPIKCRVKVVEVDEVLFFIIFFFFFFFVKGCWFFVGAFRFLCFVFTIFFLYFIICNFAALNVANAFCSCCCCRCCVVTCNYGSETKQKICLWIFCALLGSSAFKVLFLWRDFVCFCFFFFHCVIFADFLCGSHKNTFSDQQKKANEWLLANSEALKQPGSNNCASALLSSWLARTKFLYLYRFSLLFIHSFFFFAWLTLLALGSCKRQRCQVRKELKTDSDMKS